MTANRICCFCNKFEIDPKDIPGLNVTSGETWICQKCENKLRGIIKLYDRFMGENDEKDI